MQNSAKNIECVKKKLPEFKKLTISIKRKSDNSVRIISGLSLDQILRELVVNQENENDFSARRKSGGNLNRPENSVLNSSFSSNVSGVKTNLRFSSNSCKNQCETTKIRLGRSFNKHGKHAKFSKKFFVDNERGSAFKRSWNTSNNKKEKTESESPPNANFDTSQYQMEKKKCKFNKTTKGNEFFNIQEPVDAVNKVVEESDSRICVIQEVFGNAVRAFSGSDGNSFCDDADVICLDSKEAQLIVPKKTDDITKIKGWRRKQFFVEKPTAVEFQEFSYDNTTSNKIAAEQNHLEPNDTSLNSHAENAFVCESLDEFLEQDAKLKINYEIPHLFAEVGIKLTKEEIASAPEISEKDIKEVETKYCRSVPSQNDISIDNMTTDKIKRGKRHNADDNEESFKIVKLENNSMRLIRMVKKSTGKETDVSNKSPSIIEDESKEKNVNEINLGNTDFDRMANDNRIKLTSKVLGLVVYPSPHKPLHPIVQFHLRKLRSYHTAIDSNWANFAASVVIRKDSKYQRCILPATCCVKILNDSVNSKDKITSVTPAVTGADVAKEALSPIEKAKSIKKVKEDQCSQLSKTKIFSVEELERMKNCRVVIKKLYIGPDNKSWCKKHDRLNCKNCNVKICKSIPKQFSMEKTGENIINKPTEYEKPVRMSSQPAFYEDVVNLLAKKLKIFHPDSLTSIDSLKTLNFNAVELIKLKFIQKSFWHNYIRIWYLEPEKGDVRSRAFLTFSKTPPVPNAINLRCGPVVNNLPKVMREIIYAEKCVDPNEYVLLYCNGNYWEIHGSVNVAFNKSIKSADQVLIPTELPELKKLQSISFKMLQAKAFKWWVLDLTQQFQIIELKSENLIANISQKKLLEFIKHYTSGFLPLRKNSGGRTFGAYITQNLLPYALIGPYYLFEIHNVSLKGDFSTLPFVYNETKDSDESNLLKFLISSTIKETKNNGKAVEGLWLHYRTFVDDSCFLEIMTSCDVNTMSRSNYSIHEEHGYSLNSTSVPDLNHKNVNSCRGNLQVEVYLYFDIFGLGYVLGVLEEDNSVTITHPLNERTKVNSTEIGNWFLGILRRRLRFVPKNLVVKWFITKSKSHLKNRPPFNKNFLNGAHILTDSGVFYVLKLSDPNNQDSILNKGNILEAAGKSTVIEEVVYLKILSDMLVRSPVIKPSMDKVLTAAIKEITRLQKKLSLLERVKACLEEEKLGLFNSYLMTIHLKGLNKKLSVVLLKQIEKLFFSENGKINETYMKKLKLYNFGRQYLKTIGKQKLVKLNKKNPLQITGE